MNATAAIQNLRTDLAELEARGYARPALINAKRSWIDAVEHELQQLSMQLEELKQRCNDEHQQRIEAEHRTGMLANVLSILGFNPMQHVRRPLYHASWYEPDVYLAAAQHCAAMDAQEGTPDHIYRAYRNPAMYKMKLRLDNALWHARLTIALRPHQHLIATHGQESTQAAAA